MEEIIIKITSNLRKEYNIENICLAGGVALNCVANGKILSENIFNNIWIQPAAGDSGCALGAALGYWYSVLSNERKIEPGDSMKGSLLGPKYSSEEIKKFLNKSDVVYKEHTYDEILELCAQELNKGKTIGFFQGRMEFGPRALGCRSIIADPRSSNMQKNLNLKIKFRESFRPFAPIVLESHVNEYFKLNTQSPYMLLVSEIKDDLKILLSDKEKKLFGLDKLNLKRSSIPSVTHVDYSARIQTVNNKNNDILFQLLKKFYELTNCPVLINTSFNIRGEPIVCSPEDAYKCFMGTNLDILILENFIVYKNNQEINNIDNNYKNNFKLD